MIMFARPLFLAAVSFFVALTPAVSSDDERAKPATTYVFAPPPAPTPTPTPTPLPPPPPAPTDRKLPSLPVP